MSTKTTPAVLPVVVVLALLAALATFMTSWRIDPENPQPVPDKDNSYYVRLLVTYRAEADSLPKHIRRTAIVNGEKHDFPKESAPHGTSKWRGTVLNLGPYKTIPTAHITIDVAPDYHLVGCEIRVNGVPVDTTGIPSKFRTATECGLPPVHEG